MVFGVVASGICSQLLVAVVVAVVFSSTAIYAGAAEQDVGSPLRVAQCRATCLKKFSNKDPYGEWAWMQGEDSRMCWENCEKLQSNFQGYGVMCDEREICFPGCQEACSFHAEISKRTQQSQPVIHTKGEAVINVTGGHAQWPRPSAVEALDTPLVYVVMRRSPTGPWRQLIQTLDLKTRVPVDSDKADSTLRVLVVNANGLVTIYSPYESSLTMKKRKKTINTENMSRSASADKWQLVEVSLIYQQFLVISEIAWEPKSTRGVYLVTWEVDGGGLRGNLYTDSTSVTLSLWPDTIYHIQVELVSNNSGGNHMKSEMLDVDTGKALRVATDQVHDFMNLYDNEEKEKLVLLREKSELLNSWLNSVRSEKMRNPNSIWYDVLRNSLDILACAVVVLVSLSVFVVMFYFVRRRFNYTEMFPNPMYIEKINKALGTDILRPIMPEAARPATSTLPPEVVANILLASSLAAADKSHPELAAFGFTTAKDNDNIV